MAVNYLEEGARAVPAPINAFTRPPIIIEWGYHGTPDVPATVSKEAELGWSSASGPRCRAADAMNYVFGYLNFIDGSARSLPPRAILLSDEVTGYFCSMGPFW
jgi:2-keto-4-pentenoate hydratase/2-oxohepta-3-ene-1,7-dioic acid hydratase in catechol pathway